MSCNWPHPHDCAAMELARIERDLAVMPEQDGDDR